jgi:hypothetical protein
MSWNALALPVAALALLGGGCRRTAPMRDVDVSCRVEPAPPRMGKVRVFVTLAGQAPPGPVAGASVKVEGTMTHPGMTPVFGAAVETKPGEYEAPLTLTMGGDWVLIVTAKLPDGRRLRREVPLPAVKGS